MLLFLIDAHHHRGARFLERRAGIAMVIEPVTLLPNRAPMYRTDHVSCAIPSIHVRRFGSKVTGSITMAIPALLSKKTGAR